MQPSCNVYYEHSHGKITELKPNGPRAKSPSSFQTKNKLVSFYFCVSKGKQKERENERSLGHWFHSALCYLHKVLLRDSYM